MYVYFSKRSNWYIGIIISKRRKYLRIGIVSLGTNITYNSGHMLPTLKNVVTQK